MSRSTPQLRDLARHLITLDMGGNKKSSSFGSPDVLQVCEKLRPQLTTMVGNEAFRVLLAHALFLTNAEVSGLHTVKVNLEGMLEVSEEDRAQIVGDKFFEGNVVLLAHVLGLLVAFIGENLTLRLVRGAWPRVEVDNLSGDNGDKK